MKRKRMLSALLVVAMAATMFAGCGNKGGSNSSTQGGKAANDGDIKEFTAFFAVPGSEINDDNEVQHRGGRGVRAGRIYPLRQLRTADRNHHSYS